MKLLEYIFLASVVLLSQMPATFSQDERQTLVESKVKKVEQLRDLRQKAKIRDIDLQIINGGGITPNTSLLLHDPFVRLNDTNGRPSVVWLTSYGGDPLGWEVIFFALMPLALAKVIRSSRNIFRPDLHLRQGITDFPLVPLIYLQQTKLEQRVKREKRNGIDWLGKKFLIRASDNFVEIKEVKHQPTQRVVPKNPWALLRFMTKFNVVYQHAQARQSVVPKGVSKNEKATAAPGTPIGTDETEDLNPKNPLLAKILEVGRASRVADAFMSSGGNENQRNVKVKFSPSPTAVQPVQYQPKMSLSEEDDEEDDEDEGDEEEEPPISVPTEHKRKVSSEEKHLLDMSRKTSFQVISEKQKPHDTTTEQHDKGQGHRKSLDEEKPQSQDIQQHDKGQGHRQSMDEESKPKPHDIEQYDKGQDQKRQSMDGESKPKPQAWGSGSKMIHQAAAAAPNEPEVELPYHLRQLKDFIPSKEIVTHRRKLSDREADPEAPSSPGSDDK